MVSAAEQVLRDLREPDRADAETQVPPSHIPNHVSRLQALRYEQEIDTFIYSGPSHVP